MKTLVTGATGKVGHAVASALLERGDEVRALLRDPARAAGQVPDGIERVQGDVSAPPPAGGRGGWRRARSRYRAPGPIRPRSGAPPRAASSSSTPWGCPSNG